MTAQHTPGPWSVEKCVANHLHPYYEQGTIIQTVDSEVADECIATIEVSERDEANAYLIAAAPELLEALEGLVENIPHHDSVSWDKAHAAIAKAKGGAQ